MSYVISGVRNGQRTTSKFISGVPAVPTCHSKFLGYFVNLVIF